MTDTNTEVVVSGDRLYARPPDGEVSSELGELMEAINSGDGPSLAWWGDPPAGRPLDSKWLNISFADTSDDR